MPKLSFLALLALQVADFVTATSIPTDGPTKNRDYEDHGLCRDYVPSMGNLMYETCKKKCGSLKNIGCQRIEEGGSPTDLQPAFAAYDPDGHFYYLGQCICGSELGFEKAFATFWVGALAQGFQEFAEDLDKYLGPIMQAFDVVMDIASVLLMFTPAGPEVAAIRFGMEAIEQGIEDAATLAAKFTRITKVENPPPEEFWSKLIRGIKRDPDRQGLKKNPNKQPKRPKPTKPKPTQKPKETKVHDPTKKPHDQTKRPKDTKTYKPTKHHESTKPHHATKHHEGTKTLRTMKKPHETKHHDHTKTHDHDGTKTHHPTKHHDEGTKTHDHGGTKTHHHTEHHHGSTKPHHQTKHHHEGTKTHRPTKHQEDTKTHDHQGTKTHHHTEHHHGSTKPNHPTKHHHEDTKTHRPTKHHQDTKTHDQQGTKTHDHQGTKTHRPTKHHEGTKTHDHENTKSHRPTKHDGSTKPHGPTKKPTETRSHEPTEKPTRRPTRRPTRTRKPTASKAHTKSKRPTHTSGSCGTGLRPYKQHRGRSENVSFNITKKEVSNYLSKRVPPDDMPNQYFEMNKGARFIMWEDVTTRLWTDGVCGCFVIFIVGRDGAAATHFSTQFEKAEHTAGGHSNPKFYEELANLFKEQLDYVAELSKTFKGPRAVVFMPKTVLGVPPTDEDGNGPPEYQKLIEQVLASYEIPLAGRQLHVYDPSKVAEHESFDIYVESTMQMLPMNVHFGPVSVYTI